ncbi:hypothetical protein DL990_11165 [Amycolatopsis sp. WAC 01416]|nr:hypothetical protein DL990_11165 [Amycolatopsis sp. WAC 01416]
MPHREHRGRTTNLTRAPDRGACCESHFRNLQRCESGFRNTAGRGARTPRGQRKLCPGATTPVS